MRINIIITKLNDQLGGDVQRFCWLGGGGVTQFDDDNNNIERASIRAPANIARWARKEVGPIVIKSTYRAEVGAVRPVLAWLLTTKKNPSTLRGAHAPLNRATLCPCDHVSRS